MTETKIYCDLCPGCAFKLKRWIETKEEIKND